MSSIEMFEWEMGLAWGRWTRRKSSEALFGPRTDLTDDDGVMVFGFLDLFAGGHYGICFVDVTEEL